mmetsp:Transcript_46330/g.91362  ORF Transcript_46330/g.91362 Transcript_46330/m.91362 type:complete len:429 (+) Transcript_46330:453-1739(+)
MRRRRSLRGPLGTAHMGRSTTSPPVFFFSSRRSIPCGARCLMSVQLTAPPFHWQQVSGGTEVDRCRLLGRQVSLERLVLHPLHIDLDRPHPSCLSHSGRICDCGGHHQAVQSEDRVVGVSVPHVGHVGEVLRDPVVVSDNREAHQPRHVPHSVVEIQLVRPLGETAHEQVAAFRPLFPRDGSHVNRTPRPPPEQFDLIVVRTVSTAATSRLRSRIAQTFVLDGSRWKVSGRGRRGAASVGGGEFGGGLLMRFVKRCRASLLFHLSLRWVARRRHLWRARSGTRRRRHLTVRVGIGAHCRPSGRTGGRHFTWRGSRVCRGPDFPPGAVRSGRGSCDWVMALGYVVWGARRWRTGGRSCILYDMVVRGRRFGVLRAVISPGCLPGTRRRRAYPVPEDPQQLPLTPKKHLESLPQRVIRFHRLRNPPAENA